jgi:hypothetical protein
MTFQAYNEISVRNLQLQDVAEELLVEGKLTPPQYEQVKEAFPIEFRLSHAFVRLGLFLFTGLCVIFSIALTSWITGNIDSSQSGWGVLLLFFGVTLTALNEYLIRERRWYRQGSDNALSYASVICWVLGIGLIGHFESSLSYSVLTLLFLTIATVRYGDPLLAFGAFYTLILSFIIAFDDNEISMIAVAFACATLSFTVYFFSKTALKRDDWFYWEDCFKILEIAGLVGLYASVNYFVVAELLNVNPVGNIPSPYKYIFTFLTTLVPVLYLMLGIQTKDRILWIMGSLGIVASIITYRYYFSIMPIEWALTLAGVALLLLAFFLLKYLKTPRNGFSYHPERGKTSFLESLVVNQFLPQTPSSIDDGVKMSGGDFGGGGASDEY